MSFSNKPPKITFGLSQATSCFLPGLHELLKCLLCSCDIFSCLCFLLHNSLSCLCSNLGLQLFFTFLYYLLDHPLSSCYFCCHLVGLFIQCFDLLVMINFLFFRCGTDLSISCSFFFSPNCGIVFCLPPTSYPSYSYSSSSYHNSSISGCCFFGFFVSSTLVFHSSSQSSMTYPTSTSVNLYLHNNHGFFGSFLA